MPVLIQQDTICYGAYNYTNVGSESADSHGTIVDRDTSRSQVEFSREICSLTTH